MTTSANTDAPAAREVGPQAPVRVMQIMEQLGAAPNGLPLGRLSERLKTPKSTLLSFLRVLESAGYIRSVDGVYRIAELGLRLGTIISNANPFPSSLHITLVELMGESRETTLLAVLADTGNESVYVDMVESRSAIRFSATVGTRRPLYCTAPGKTLLAAQSDAWIDRYIETTKLIRHLPNTIVDPAALRREVEKTRSLGVAETYEEYSQGVSGFAAPVYDLRNRPVAALVIAAPTARARIERDRLMECVRQGAARMSQILGAPAGHGPA